MPTPLEQTLVSKFNWAKNSFDDRWKTGAYEWLQANAIGSMVTISLAEAELEAVWALARVEKAPVADFDAALARWKTAHVEALKDFTVRSGR